MLGAAESLVDDGKPYHRLVFYGLPTSTSSWYTNNRKLIGTPTTIPVFRSPSITALGSLHEREDEIMGTQMRLTPCVLLIAAACAHEQQSVTPASPAPVVAEAPPPQPAQPPPAPKTTDDDLTRMVSQPISHFDFDMALLTLEDREKLQALAAALKANSAARIQISGNCDERGTEEYNLLLGQKRAAVAKSYLTKLGIDPARLDTISYGKDQPLDPGHTEQSWAANRRDDAIRLANLTTH